MCDRKLTVHINPNMTSPKVEQRIRDAMRKTERQAIERVRKQRAPSARIRVSVSEWLREVYGEEGARRIADEIYGGAE